MKKSIMLVVVSCIVAIPTLSFAEAPHAKVAPASVRKVAPPINAPRGGILRQDLFDRNDANNQRSDWPSPPAQPGQF